ncbi:MAG: aspartate aminotransferase [Candidatus Methanomethylicota archaeon]|uniref:Aminotransferase n=1 Tax=Thermoproteota archaeon TaxID=2056631 RepID=A0A497F2J9_9CREN|nr:MAG: aspartate aminotransferase [Candidatus Verstraetearchaeota archaeon]
MYDPIFWQLLDIRDPEVISLGLGEPIFNVPDPVKEGVIEAIKSDFTHYTSTRGIPELREAIAEKLKAENFIDVSPDNIIVTCGTSEALFYSVMAVVNPGDEVILPDPCYVSYPPYVAFSGGKVVYVGLNEDKGFSIDLESIKEKITDRTKAIIVNFPSNPTGAVLSKDDARGLAEVADDYGVVVISDEIYEGITYEERSYSPAAFSDNVVTVNGFSKAFAMTGLRIGYVAVKNEEILKGILRLHQYSMICASSISQKAAYYALRYSNDSVKWIVEEFRKRRDLIVNGLNKLGFKCPKPKGAFYVFPKIPDWGLSSTEFVVKMFKEAKVAAVPGIAFGEHGEGHVRFSYSNTIENIKQALDRLEGFIANNYALQRGAKAKTS